MSRLKGPTQPWERLGTFKEKKMAKPAKKQPVKKAKKLTYDHVILIKSKSKPRWQLLGGNEARFSKEHALEDIEYLHENLLDRTVVLMLAKVVKVL